MYNVALTGNIAAGKSAVSALLADWGATIIDADAIVRDLQRPGTPVFEAITTKFGSAVVARDGSLDRASLRGRVLAEPSLRRALELIVHPAVEAERRRRLAFAGGDAIVINDIPLLFEAGDPGRFDAVVLVDAPEPLRLARLTGSRGLPVSEAEALLKTQLPSAQKRSRADFIIDNDGSRDQLRERAWLTWRKLRSRARNGTPVRA